MKKTLLLLLFISCSITLVMAQGPPPPPPDASNGGSSGPIGGNAPLGSGVAIVLALGAAYGVNSIMEKRKADDDADEKAAL